MTGWFIVLAAKAVIVAAGLLAFGYLIVDAVFADRRLNPITRWALAFPAVVAFAFVLMLIHMATRGRILSNPWLVRAVTLAAAAALIWRKLIAGRDREAVAKADVLAAGAVVLVALVLWATPVVRVVPLGLGSADTRWHMGWSSQLMNGESTPSALLTGSVPNYYPWMFHAVVAFVAALTPGGRAYHALGPLQILQVAAAALLLFAIGRTVGRTWVAGALTALFGCMAAGLALALIGRFDALAHTPRTGGPRGTYNASYNNLAPPLPRDLGYTLLLAFLLLVIAGTLDPNRVAFVAAGVLLGITGLTSAEFYFVGLGVAVLLAVFPTGPSRREVALSLLIPAVGLYAIWLAPLIASYLRLGGFVNTTGVGPIILSPLEIMMSWGLVTPFAAYTALRWFPRHRGDVGARILFGFAVAAGALVAVSSVIPRILGPGFGILGRGTRYWPVLYLAIALLAAVGAAELIQRAASWNAVAGVGLGTLIVAIAVPLPVDVSLAASTAGPPSPALGSALLATKTNYLTQIGAPGRVKCVVAAPGNLPLLIFSYTGYRQVSYRGLDRHRGNFARIRWRDIYRYIPSDPVRLADNTILATGASTPRTWRRLIRKYGVDVVVAATEDTTAIRRLAPRGVQEPVSDRTVVSMGPCRSP